MHFKAFESVYHLDRAGHLCAIVLGGGGGGVHAHTVQVEVLDIVFVQLLGQIELHLQ